MSALVRFRPFRDLDLYSSGFFSLFDDYCHTNGIDTFEPKVDIKEEDDKIMLSADLPGLEKQDVKISITENVLSISGERSFEKEDKKEDYTRVERSYGSFNRCFQLPDNIDVKKVDAKMKSGVLKITLPRGEKPQPKQIKVTAT